MTLLDEEDGANADLMAAAPELLKLVLLQDDEIGRLKAELSATRQVAEAMAEEKKYLQEAAGLFVTGTPHSLDRRIADRKRDNG